MPNGLQARERHLAVSSWQPESLLPGVSSFLHSGEPGSILATAMRRRYILTEYMDRAMDGAVYDKLADGTFAGRIPECLGVVSFGVTLKECAEELRSILEDWILLGIKLGHPLPVIAGVDLNQEPIREPVDAL